ncbi:unnamed protein product [Rotaria sordida]|uniref:Mediator of RNA polymerase II transcription subunit 7 n=1 Tax=Rotaria sordida TaxID=392033 RepID=A0A815G4V5_9BILA|nr:unnamed protein product [Rotaria sordida]CAF1333904.1 unnamed protein product [Rotaria sordida]CAF3841995.1 unnamed protein product [Rotaria sordida]CAF3886245.1 unnamed protein product [Rotaria sordida]
MAQLPDVYRAIDMYSDDCEGNYEKLIVVFHVGMLSAKYKVFENGEYNETIPWNKKNKNRLEINYNNNESSNIGCTFTLDDEKLCISMEYGIKPFIFFVGIDKYIKPNGEFDKLNDLVSFYKNKITYCIKLKQQNRQTTINNETSSSSYTTYTSSSSETLQSSNASYNLSINQRSKNSNLGHMSRSVDHRNLPLPHMQSQDIHLHHRMLSQPDSMSRHVNPHQPDNISFMDLPPLLSSAFPLPPMGYIELFSDDNIRQNNKILQPPPPIEGPYELFGVYVNGIDNSEPIIHPLAAQQIQCVDIRSDDYKGELKKLCFAILTNYLDLLQIVSRSPVTPSPDSGNITLREQKLNEIELLFSNIHYLINELRPHQARETLRIILEKQK